MVAPFTLHPQDSHPHPHPQAINLLFVFCFPFFSVHFSSTRSLSLFFFVSLSCLIYEGRKNALFFQLTLRQKRMNIEREKWLIFVRCKAVDHESVSNGLDTVFFYRTQISLNIAVVKKKLCLDKRCSGKSNGCCTINGGLCILHIFQSYFRV